MATVRQRSFAINRDGISGSRIGHPLACEGSLRPSRNVERLAADRRQRLRWPFRRQPECQLFCNALRNAIVSRCN